MLSSSNTYNIKPNYQAVHDYLNSGTQYLKKTYDDPKSLRDQLALALKERDYLLAENKRLKDNCRCSANNPVVEKVGVFWRKDNAGLPTSLDVSEQLTVAEAEKRAYQSQVIILYDLLKELMEYSNRPHASAYSLTSSAIYSKLKSKITELEANEYVQDKSGRRARSPEPVSHTMRSEADHLRSARSTSPHLSSMTALSSKHLPVNVMSLPRKGELNNKESETYSMNYSPKQEHFKLPQSARKSEDSTFMEDERKSLSTEHEQLNSERSSFRTSVLSSERDSNSLWSPSAKLQSGEKSQRGTYAESLGSSQLSERIGSGQKTGQDSGLSSTYYSSGLAQSKGISESKAALNEMTDILLNLGKGQGKVGASGSRMDSRSRSVNSLGYSSERNLAQVKNDDYFALSNDGTQQDGRRNSFASSSSVEEHGKRSSSEQDDSRLASKDKLLDPSRINSSQEKVLSTPTWPRELSKMHSNSIIPEKTNSSRHGEQDDAAHTETSEIVVDGKSIQQQKDSINTEEEKSRVKEGEKNVESLEAKGENGDIKHCEAGKESSNAECPTLEEIEGCKKNIQNYWNQAADSESHFPCQYYAKKLEERLNMQERQIIQLQNNEKALLERLDRLESEYALKFKALNDQVSLNEIPRSLSDISQIGDGPDRMKLLENQIEKLKGQLDELKYFMRPSMPSIMDAGFNEENKSEDNWTSRNGDSSRRGLASESPDDDVSNTSMHDGMMGLRSDRDLDDQNDQKSPEFASQKGKDEFHSDDIKPDMVMEAGDISQQTEEIERVVDERIYEIEQLVKNEGEMLRKKGVGDCGLIVGIDCTTSNIFTGKKSFGNHHLHYISPRKLNFYERVMSIMGGVVDVLSQEGQTGKFPVYVFGDDKTRDKTVRPLYMNRKGGHECHGVSHALAEYRKQITKIGFSGPTSFKPLIEAAIKIARVKRQFQLLIIIGDGGVTDMNETIKTIVKASYFPIMIIMVGVGDGDYKKYPTDPWFGIKKLQEKIPKRKFNNFSFILFNNEMKPQEFAQKALAKVPDAYKFCAENEMI